MTLKIPNWVKSDRTALIDGDIIVYRCGFAGKITYVDLYSPDGELVETFPNVTMMDHYLDAYDIAYEGYYYEIEEHWDKLENVLHTVKKTLDSIMEATEAAHSEIYLTGKGNFREEVAVSKGYKGTRSEDSKPYHYQDIKDYLLNYRDAVLVEGIEADDMLAIRHKELSDSVICTLDKDLRMVEGYHYNFSDPNSDVFYISKLEGLANFYKQMIEGDTVDNIPGLPKYGPAKSAVIDGCANEIEMFQTVWNMYHDAGYDETYFDEQATLLWMLTDREDSWARQRERIETEIQWMSDSHQRKVVQLRENK